MCALLESSRQVLTSAGTVRILTPFPAARRSALAMPAGDGFDACDLDPVPREVSGSG